MISRRPTVVCVLVLGLSAPSRAAPPERALSLAEVLAHADEHAPAIAVAAGRAGVAGAAVVAADPWLPADPDVELGAGGRVGGGQDGADLSVGLRQTLEVFGEQGLRRAAAHRAVEAADADVAVARFRVHQAVHKAFHAALVADAEVEAAAAAVVFADRVVEVAEARVKAGDASSLTVRLARTSSQRAREQELSARAQQRAARLALGREAGFADATPIQPRGALADPPALPTSEALLSLAEQHQPALAALRARVGAAEAAQALADREALPKPTFGVGYAAEGVAPSSTQTQQLLQASLALPLPFFRGNDAERARAAAERRVAAAELEGERRQLAARIAEAWALTDAARRRVLLFTESILPGLDETLAQLELGFRLGEIEVTEVLVGREQVLAARRDALAAWRTWFDALSDLEAEVGAELPASPPLPSSSSPSP